MTSKIIPYLHYALTVLEIIVLLTLFLPVIGADEVKINGFTAVFGYRPSETFGDITASVQYTLFSINNFLGYLLPLIGLALSIIRLPRYANLKHALLALLAVSSLIFLVMLPNSFAAARTDNFIASGFFLANTFRLAYGAYIGIVANSLIIIIASVLIARILYAEEKDHHADEKDLPS